MPHRPADHSATQVWAVPLSLATTQGILSFPAGTKMFQFPAFPPTGLWVQPVVLEVGCPPQAGFPIRTSPDITPAHGSPRLIAVYHVLHRLLAPRHPPCALSSLIHVNQKLKYLRSVQLLRYSAACRCPSGLSLATAAPYREPHSLTTNPLSHKAAWHLQAAHRHPFDCQQKPYGLWFWSFFCISLRTTRRKSIPQSLRSVKSEWA